MSDYFHPEIKHGAFGKGTADDVKLKQYDPKDEDIEHTTVKGLTSIIIPAYFITYPLFHQTGNCIGSIREYTKKPYEIILVMNGNGKSVIPYSQGNYITNADKVIVNEENLGYAKAVNQGIRASQGEYIAVINNDVQVYENWLEDMQESLEHLDLVEATPMYGMPFARAKEARELRENTLHLPIEETFDPFRDFSCIMVKRTLFEELGTFNEEYFCYGEDIDLIKRMEEKNKKHASTKRVNIHHIIGSTASALPETPELMNEAKERLKARWGI